MPGFLTSIRNLKKRFLTFTKVNPVMVFIAGLVLVLASATASAVSDRHKDHVQNTEAILAAGYSELRFSAPEPGTYELPPLGLASDGRVIDSKGNKRNLHSLLGDKITLLSFIFSSCNDINGCPLATYVMSKVQDRVLKDSDLNYQVKIISLSFDPGQDTPQVMHQYGSTYKKPGFEWYFLTTSNDDELLPILNAYNQSIQRDINENNEEVGTISHILRVFLIDRNKLIRNIYSTSFLHADTLVNDIRTLIHEYGGATVARSNVSFNKPDLHGAGDNKDGYETKNYKTHALSLDKRTGKPANLMQYVNNPPLGLPAVDFPDDNPITAKKIHLGRQLFFDRRLSHNNTFSCAMCHIPEQGFTSNEMATAVGIEGRSVRRNSPTLYNVVYQDRFFHDARESTLEQQIWGPLLANNEMANPSIGYVIEKIQSIPEYEQKFKQAFDGKSASMETIGKAIASYERVLISANSPFDRWYFDKDDSALPLSAKRGHEIFSGKGNCIACHHIGNQYALFTDNQLHNTGIGYRDTIETRTDKRKIMIAPGQFLIVDKKVIADASIPPSNDLGRYEITGDPDDRWKYKTPGLRNIALTAPYMHNGSITSLRDVVQFYNQGGIENELLDPLIKPLNLNEAEIDDLVNFLHSLTGDNVDKIIADAFAEPIGNENNKQ